MTTTIPSKMALAAIYGAAKYPSYVFSYDEASSAFNVASKDQRVSDRFDWTLEREAKYLGKTEDQLKAWVDHLVTNLEIRRTK